MKLLHIKHAYDCTEEELENHMQELEKHQHLLAHIPDYECLYIMQYIDVTNEGRTVTYELGNISEAVEMTEYFNRLNGYDFTVSHEGYLNIHVYGYAYDYRTEQGHQTGVDTVEIRVIPFDPNGNLMDISKFLITEGKQPVTYARNQTIYSNLITSLKEEQYLEQSVGSEIDGFNSMK